MEETHFGLVWYRRSDYARIRRIMLDGETLESTFDKWQGLAEKTERRLQASGTKTYRILVDPDKFVAWCAANGRQTDSSARAAFAADRENWSHLDQKITTGFLSP